MIRQLLYRIAILCSGLFFIAAILWLMSWIFPLGPPKAEIESFFARPIEGRAPLEAIFLATLKVDQQCQPAILLFDYGDGRQVRDRLEGGSKVAHWSHIYDSPGIYNVTVTIFESEHQRCNRQSTSETTIKVLEPIPPGADLCQYATNPKDIQRSGEQYLYKKVTVIIKSKAPEVQPIYMHAQGIISGYYVDLVDSDSDFRIRIGPFPTVPQLNTLEKFAEKRLAVPGLVEQNRGEYELKLTAVANLDKVIHFCTEGT